jgi:acyl carrier protein
VDEVLLGHPDVVQAVAFAIPDLRLGEEVGAAVILTEGASITERQLRDYVAERLAEFKVPRRILFVDEIPKGPTGKIQRIGLAEKLGIGLAPETPQAVAEYVPPQTMVEEVLAEIWADVLGLERMGTQDAFLDLGGDSMLATQIVARIREMIQVDVSLRDFFDAPTIADMASIIEHALLSEMGDTSE